MKIAICAGEKNAALLKERLESGTSSENNFVTETFTRREDLLYRMKEQRYDVVIVALPGAMGMETALGARQFAPDAVLIWASDEPAFIAQSYRLRAAMFLSLPLVEEQVVEALRRVRLHLHGEWSKSIMFSASKL